MEDEKVEGNEDMNMQIISPEKNNNELDMSSDEEDD